MISDTSNAGGQQDQPPAPRPDGRFVKGDPRINRKGRPKSFDEVRELAQTIAHEELTLENGRKLTVVDAILRRWAKSTDPTLQKAFMEYAFGKVPDKLETTGLEHRTTLILHYAHEFDGDGDPDQRPPPRFSHGAN